MSLMIIYGKQLFLHLLAKHPQKFENIYLAKEVHKDIFNKIAKCGVKIHKVDTQKAQAMARGGNHQGFLAEVSEFEFADFASLKRENFLAILYGLSDVGNIGAITRTAHAMGFGGVIVVAKSLSIEGLVRASSGAAYEIPICLFDDGLSLINELKQVGFKVYAADARGVSANSVEFGSKTALVMGSEGEGIHKKALEKCDQILSIKMKNNWDSLNVSVAFGILCDRIING